MEVSIKLENINGKRGMAVYVAGRCIKHGLTEAEASALVARLVNEQFSQAKI